jgi:hypothetical protein
VKFVADWIGAIGAVATAAFALLVFLETRHIRRTDWLIRQNAAWNDFDRAVLEYGGGTRFIEFMRGGVMFPPHDFKEEYLLLILFNTMSNEYNALRSNVLASNYVVSSFMNYAGAFYRNREWLLPMLEAHGFESGYINMLSELMQVDGEEIAARKVARRAISPQSHLARVMGPAFIRWLRKRNF